MAQRRRPARRPRGRPLKNPWAPKSRYGDPRWMQRLRALELCVQTTQKACKGTASKRVAQNCGNVESIKHLHRKGDLIGSDAWRRWKSRNLNRVRNGEFFLPTHDEVLRRVFRWLGEIPPSDLPDLERTYSCVRQEVSTEVPDRLEPDGEFYFPELTVLSKLIPALADLPGFLRRYLPRLIQGYIQRSGRLAEMKASGREGRDFLAQLYSLMPENPDKHREFRDVVYEVCSDQRLCQVGLWDQPDVRKARRAASRHRL